MITPKFVLTISAILLIILGLLQQNKSLVEGYIKWSNSLKGVKSQITKQTIFVQKLYGLIFIFIGVGLLIWAYILRPFSNG